MYSFILLFKISPFYENLTLSCFYFSAESTDVTPEYLLSCLLSGSYYMPPETLLRSQSSAGTVRQITSNRPTRTSVQGISIYIPPPSSNIALERIHCEGRRIRYKSYRKVKPTWISMKDKSGTDGQSQFIIAAYANIPRLTFDANGEATRGVFRCGAACYILISVLHLRWISRRIVYIVLHLSICNCRIRDCNCVWDSGSNETSENLHIHIIMFRTLNCSRLYKFQLSPEISGPLNEALASNAMKDAISSLGIGDGMLWCIELRCTVLYSTSLNFTVLNVNFFSKHSQLNLTLHLWRVIFVDVIVQ